jgi:transposase
VRTILSYFEHYNNGGSTQLLQNNDNGKEPKLSAKQEAELAEHLRKSIYSSSIDIIHFVKVTFNVTFSRTGRG